MRDRAVVARIVGALGAAMLVGVGCGSDSSSGPTSAGVREVSGSEILPSETLSDWVTYADAVVSVTITAEAEVPPRPEEEARGEGLIVRHVTAQIDEIAWAHPSASDVPRATFTFVATGWIMHDGIRTPAAQQGAARLEVGGRYLMPITEWSPGGWAPITPSSVTAITDEGRVASASTASTRGHPSEAEQQLAGLSTSSVARALSDTSPDPLGEANRHLDADDRYQVVAESRSNAQP